MTASATDADLPAKALTYSLDAASQDLGMTIDSATGTFRWMPDATQGLGSYDVTITVADNASPAASDWETFTIVGALSWQNASHPGDVDGDGNITAADALRLTSDINAHGARDLLPAPPPTSPPPPCLDPSGDDQITPIEVLIVINYINAHGSGPIPSEPGGEGEYDSPIDRDAQAIPVSSHVVGFASDIGGSIVASAWPFRDLRAVWPASVQSASRTTSTVARARAVADTLLDCELEASDLEDAITAIAGAVTQAWDSQRPA